VQLRDVLIDLRVALRTLLRTPAFFGTATLVLALGISVVVVMFGFLRVTTTPPPLDQVEGVYALPVEDVRRDNPEGWVRLQDIEDWADQQTSFEGVAGFWGETVSFRRAGEGPERLLAGRVTGPFFTVLHVHPLLGRNLVATDARKGAEPVVVLSERLWRASFGADPTVIGERLKLNGETTTVVGVAPAALDLPVAALLWFPDRTDTAFDTYLTGGVGPLPRILAPQMMAVGRLRAGVTPEAAQRELRDIQARRAARYPEVAGEVPEVAPLSIFWLGPEYQRLLRVLFGSVLLVLGLACVNVVGLLLVRGAERTHEAAVRRALGAGRLRLAGQMLAESAIIGAAAALLAATLASAAMEVLRRVIPALLPTAPSWWQIELDGPTFLFALGTALAAALGAGLYPAIRATRVCIDPLLREGSRDSGFHAGRVVRWLVVVEIAMSAALLTTAGLVIRAGARLGSGDVGVPTAGYLVAQVELPPGYSLNRQRQFAGEVVEKLRALPGVEDATATTSPPGITAHFRPNYHLLDPTLCRVLSLPSAAVVEVAPGFFETFGIAVQGRALAEADGVAGGVYCDGGILGAAERLPCHPTAAVVSRSLARVLWPGQDPIGKVMRIAPEQSWLPPVQVVGVADDVRYDERLRSLGSPAPVVYVPVTRWPSRQLYLVVRAPEPLDAAEGLRRVVRHLDPEVPVFSIRTLDEERARNAAAPTLLGRMFAAFGVVALALAAAGVYGVLAYSMAQGARDIAIRRALGAPGGRIAGGLVARSAGQLVLGLGLGMALAAAIGGWVGSEIGQPDPHLGTYMVVDALLTVVLILAVLIPLWRALTVEPSAVLRHP
jgi:predicted permease